MLSAVLAVDERSRSYSRSTYVRDWSLRLKKRTRLLQTLGFARWLLENMRGVDRLIEGVSSKSAREQSFTPTAEKFKVDKHQWISNEEK